MTSFFMITQTSITKQIYKKRVGFAYPILVLGCFVMDISSHKRAHGDDLITENHDALNMIKRIFSKKTVFIKIKNIVLSRKNTKISITENIHYLYIKSTSFALFSKLKNNENAYIRSFFNLIW